MKGLLIKDIRLMKNMRNSLIMILVIAAGMSSYISDTSFLITYLGMIGVTFTNSTLSYDEFDNGFAFLFSLPVTRKHYVLEKYLFGMLLCGGGWLAGTVLALVSGTIRGSAAPLDSLAGSFLLLPLVMILLAVLLPFHLKFGPEKGRIAMMVILGGFFLVIVLAAKLLSGLAVKLPQLTFLSSMGTGMIAAASVGIAVLFLALSCRISISIMDKREF